MRRRSEYLPRPSWWALSSVLTAAEPGSTWLCPSLHPHLSLDPFGFDTTHTGPLLRWPQYPSLSPTRKKMSCFSQSHHWTLNVVSWIPREMFSLYLTRLPSPFQRQVCGKWVQAEPLIIPRVPGLSLAWSILPPDYFLPHDHPTPIAALHCPLLKPDSFSRPLETTKQIRDCD